MAGNPADETAPKLTLPAWGHASGLLRLGSPTAPQSGNTADRLFFQERIARYCWAYDERQVEALSDCFTEDAVWEGNVLGQVQIGPFQGRNRIVSWLTEFWPHQHDQRRHMLLNTLVEGQSSETGLTLSYLLLMSSDGKSLSLETSGFYRVQYRRIGTNWQIERLTAGFDAPFWPGELRNLSSRGRTRHGIGVSATPPGEPG